MDEWAQNTLMEIFFPYLANVHISTPQLLYQQEEKNLLLDNEYSIFDISFHYHQNIHIDALLEEKIMKIPNYETSQNVQC